MVDEAAERQFGERVKALRIERGWSQERLAQQMIAAGHRWRQNIVTRVEAGDRPIRVNEAATLARILGVPIAALFDPGIDADTAYQLHGVHSARVEL